MLVIWSLRYSTARGWTWSHERNVSTEEAQAYLNIFKADEPNIFFVACEGRPKDVTNTTEANSISWGPKRPSFRKKAYAATAIYAE